MATAPKAAPIMMTATKTQDELQIANQTRLESRRIGTVKVVFKGTGLLYIESAQRVAGQRHLMPTNRITKIRWNVPFDILVAKLTRTTVHVPKLMVLFSSSDIMVVNSDPEDVDRERRPTISIVQTFPNPPR